ncbi:endo alpha-1,4 polygalactosaminidase [Thalassospira sp. TSL5-1]|uniref:endo alpha-1,4 polygalactosaminidase n=1 Tax=Thalassospira sp. TSL5-1 TaxID=1544451 RepID=UPI000AC8ACEE|nr:endo alpha-1,4 polygalactosaminidase [Thalassospira sp. TSL5-1]
MLIMVSALALRPAGFTRRHQSETASGWRLFSRSFFLAGLMAGLMISSLPFHANAQQLEPFVPPANSLSNSPDVGDNKDEDDSKPKRDFAEEMRKMIVSLSRWAKNQRSDFSIIAMNGLDLTTFIEPGLFVTKSDAKPARNFIRALDGFLVEAPRYGRDGYNKETAEGEVKYDQQYLERLSNTGMRFFMLDYTDKMENIRKSRQNLKDLDPLYYAAPPPDMQLSALAKVPSTPFNENPFVIDTIHKARNYAMVIDSAPFGNKDAYVNALANTNYDILILDAFHRGTVPLTFDDMRKLRYKKLGTPRLLLAYVDVGTAQTYRYYWRADWRAGSPDFISSASNTGRWGQENHVYYWEPQWQNIIFGNANSYVAGLMQLGFDGIVIDGVDDYRWWADQ